ncbi:RBK1 [Candida pseudojiufengensis]|uniref:RBK1 n=1 Tax=Candida pseudojiufengensis TaxID=497109 RepID=UPI0022245F32|nr:RBK1 [Candida pseudojiufengensis]KAI5961446.1 RBK1 [Candida pseudojiufengensis]
MSKPIVTIIGSLNYDLVTFTNKVPQGGETYTANSFETHQGGKGLNEAIAVSRLSPTDKIHTRMIGRIGDDDFGSNLINCLKESGVDVKYVETIKGISSGVATIIVESNGENRILITPGSNGKLKPTDEEYKNYFENIDSGFVVLQNEYPDSEKTINWLKLNKPKINIAYNPSPFKEELITNEIWSKIDLLIVNEGEAIDVAKKLLPNIKLNEDIEGFQQLAIEIHKLINQENIKTVIITMGSKGSLYYDGTTSTPKFINSKKIDNVIDTTGAGDTFFGGVISNLSLGKTIEDSVIFATTASSLAIQKKGAAEGIPTYEEVLKNL